VKTAIDYINDLLDERSVLLARLHRARSTLPPGHPALVVPPRRIHPSFPGDGVSMSGLQTMDGLQIGENMSMNGHALPMDALDEGPLWEREWKGGHGKLGNVEEEAEESS
jgi:hypothetical protein